MNGSSNNQAQNNPWLWFHGSPNYFHVWGDPTGPASLSNQWASNIPHSFLSFSSDYNYASQYAGNNGHLYTTTLASSARVLDLQIRSYGSVKLWTKLRKTFIGRHNQRIKTLPQWFAACQSGDIIEYVSTGNMQSVIHNLIVSDKFPTLLSNQQHWSLEDLKRAIIETTMRTAWHMGYDAVICREKITEKSITQLYVTSIKHLSPPNWIQTAP